MIDYLGMVREFHQTFDCVRNPSPTLLLDKYALWRLRLIQEELAELTKAMADGNIVEIADALADLHYVTFGTDIAYGLPMDKIFEQVHESNMTKKGGHHDNTGKFIKPDTYKPVNLGWLLESEGTK